MLEFLRRISKVKKAEAVLMYMNRKCGRHFHLVPSTKRMIMLRLKETIEDENVRFMQVARMLSYKWDKWHNNEMEIYYRPSTIFRPSHFSEYVTEADFYSRKHREVQIKIWKKRMRGSAESKEKVSKEDVEKIRQKLSGLSFGGIK